MLGRCADALRKHLIHSPALTETFLARRATLWHAESSDRKRSAVQLERDKDVLPYYSYAGNFAPNVFRRHGLVGTSRSPSGEPFLPSGDAECVGLRQDFRRRRRLVLGRCAREDPVRPEFLIRDTPKSTGGIKVGAIDYRSEDVNNIAVHVVVYSAAYSQ
jgi:hypothetical protein